MPASSSSEGGINVASVSGNCSHRRETGCQSCVLVSSINEAFLRFLTFLTLSLSLSSKTTTTQCTNSRRRCLNTASGVSSPKRTGNEKAQQKARRVKISSNVLDAHENTAESERENWTRRVWDFDLERSTTRRRKRLVEHTRRCGK